MNRLTVAASVLAMLIGIGMWLFLQGRSAERGDQNENYVKTRERIDNAPVPDGPDAVIDSLRRHADP